MAEEKGSFTVEAALLMTLIIPVLTALLYGSFYLHDCAVMQGAACELAAVGSTLRTKPDREALMEQKRKKLLQGRLLGTRDSSMTLAVSESEVKVSCSGNFYVPGLVGRLLGEDLGRIEKSWTRKLQDPAGTIRKVRGLRAMLDAAKG